MGQVGETEDMQDTDLRTWAPLTQAAEAYGVSVDTIRRRIKRQELDTRREMTPQGFRWLVPLPDPEKAAKSIDSPSEVPGSPRSEVAPVYGPHIIQIPDSATIELISTLQRNLEERTTEIGLLHGEIERLQATLEQQAKTIDRAVAMIPAPVAVDTGGPGTLGKSWWFRLRRWVNW